MVDNAEVVKELVELYERLPDLEMCFRYNVCLEKGSDQLIVTLYTLSFYPSVHKQLNQTLLRLNLLNAINDSRTLELDFKISIHITI